MIGNKVLLWYDGPAASGTVLTIEGSPPDEVHSMVVTSTEEKKVLHIQALAVHAGYAITVASYCT